MSVNLRQFDVRVVEQNIARGRITREQFEAFLASLPDEGDFAEPTRASMTDIYNARLARQEEAE